MCRLFEFAPSHSHAAAAHLYTPPLNRVHHKSKASQRLEGHSHSEAELAVGNLTSARVANRMSLLCAPLCCWRCAHCHRHAAVAVTRTPRDPPTSTHFHHFCSAAGRQWGRRSTSFSNGHCQPPGNRQPCPPHQRGRRDAHAPAGGPMDVMQRHFSKSPRFACCRLGSQ